MGLTIHYTLRHHGTIEDAKVLVEQLRERALDLPFQEVGELKEFTFQEGEYERFLNPKTPEECERFRENEDRWMLVQSSTYLKYSEVQKYDDPNWPYRKKGEKIQYSLTVGPKQLIAFEAWPGEGCESMNIGLCVYPEEICVRTEEYNRACRGWRKWYKVRQSKYLHWNSFCKTQYASEIGTNHFVKCHLCVIRMLDKAKELGILHEVHDEGGFWKTRNLNKLIQNLDDYNVFVRAFLTALESIVGSPRAIESPISHDANAMDYLKCSNPEVAEALCNFAAAASEAEIERANQVQLASAIS